MSEIKLFNCDCKKILKEMVVPENAIIVTDPPFNIGYKYKSYKDNMAEEEYLKMLLEVCGNKAVVILYPETLHKFSVYGGG